jgi:DNA adenine methylase
MGALEADSGNSLWQQWAPGAVPLFRWAGGKQRFLWHHAEEIPAFTGTYHEPFAGGLSIYFHVASRSASPVPARLADVNLRLVRTYLEIKTDWQVVDDRLRQLEAAYAAAQDKSAFYYDVRDQHNRVAPAADAARFIFLMSTCWNGVFRTNSSGDFNVPHGAVKKSGTKFPTPANLRAAHEVFQHASLRACSWESSLGDVRTGDFVFLDPPYHSESRTSLYEGSRSFGLNQHESLARKLEELQSRGVNFLLTNSATPEMVDLYRSHRLSVRVIPMQRSVNVRVEERTDSDELLVTPNHVTRSALQAEAELDLKMLARRQLNRVN